MWEGLDDEVQNRILDQIEKGLEKGQRYSSDNAAKGRAAWKVVQEHVPDQTEAQCREIIRTWERRGVLYTEENDDPVRRTVTKGLRVDPNKRPKPPQQE
jgi:hypothetical protein